MNSDQLKKAYEQFFVKSEAGKYFMTEVNRLITTNHESAEDKPELSRDHVQRAKGMRDIANHIQSVMTEVKKGKPIRV